MRVRDEMKMTIAAYKTLYESSVTFGMRKMIQAEQGVPELETKKGELEKKKRQLDELVHSHQKLLNSSLWLVFCLLLGK